MLFHTNSTDRQKIHALGLLFSQSSHSPERAIHLLPYTCKKSKHSFVSEESKARSSGSKWAGKIDLNIFALFKIIK